MSAIDDIAAERQRQIEREGWTIEHDDEHDAGVMASAAACYAVNAASMLHPYDGLGVGVQGPWWPWDGSWWKPKDPRRDLVRAAALIVAEIDKIDRDAAKPCAACGGSGVVPSGDPEFPMQQCACVHATGRES